MPCAHVHLYILHEYMFLFLLTDKMLLSEGLHVPPTGSHPKLTGPPTIILMRSTALQLTTNWLFSTFQSYISGPEEE